MAIDECLNKSYLEKNITLPHIPICKGYLNIWSSWYIDVSSYMSGNILCSLIELTVYPV